MLPDRETLQELARRRAVESVRREFFRRWSVGASTVMDYRGFYIDTYQRIYRELLKATQARCDSK